MKRIVELLTLEADDGGIMSGVDKLTDRAKKGFEKAKDQHKKKEAELKNAKDKAAQAEKDAKKKIEDAKKKEEAAKKYAEKEAEHAGKTAEAEHKLKSAESIAALKDDLDGFVEDFFKNFPQDQDEDVEKILKIYPTYEAAQEALKAFKGIARRLEDLRKRFNERLVDAKKINAHAPDRLNRIANSYVGPSGKPLDADFIAFVKSEARFFKNLVQIKDDFTLDEGHFTDLMSLKIKQTAGEKVPDAATYVNILMRYAAEKFMSHARVIYAAGVNLQDEKAAAEREMRRRAIAAKAAANPDSVPENLTNIKALLK